MTEFKTNQEIIDNLTQFLRENQMKKDYFRANAYRKAIQQIRSLNYEITDVSQVVGMPGIGVKIREKIALVLEGRPKKAAIDPFIEDLLKIPGVGPVKAREISEAGVRSIAQLRARQGLLDSKQRIGLKYYDSLSKKIPRSEMDRHHALLHSIANEMKLMGDLPEFRARREGFETLDVEVAGSYRRGYAESSDIDVILTSTDPRMFGCFILLLRQYGYIIDTLSEGSKMFMGFVKIGANPARRLDIIYTTPQEYPFSLLYFTGPKRFNEELRLEARRRGLLLNQHGLFRGTARVPGLHTERAIIEYMGFPYRAPSKREG